jgi:UDP-N-acetylglucosamine:LPS N-acetylglucosamine transferase
MDASPTILCCGGGTLGPVTPLVAVARRILAAHPDARIVWAGTPDGPERAVVEANGWPFEAVPVAKLPRYPSIAWVLWPWRYIRAAVVARGIVARHRPSLVVGVGGYMQVPVMRAAAKDGIPCVLHQLDAEPGLSNRLMARLCRSVTTTFPYASPPFGADVASAQAPTPSRFAGSPLPPREEACRRLGLDPARPVVFVTGGGTGAVGLNRLVVAAKDRIVRVSQVLHLVGKGKQEAGVDGRSYHPVEFFDEAQMRDGYAAADVVVCRGGVGTLSELAGYAKAAIVVPLPHSHQERNVDVLEDAVMRVDQEAPAAAELLAALVAELLEDPVCRKEMGERLHAALPVDDGSTLAERWMGMAGVRR